MVNKTFRKGYIFFGIIIFMNYWMRTILLMGLLAGLFAGIGYLIGNTYGFYFGLIVVLGMNFFSFWFSDKIVLFMYRAKEADRNKHAHLYSLVKEIAEKAGISMPKVYIIPSANPNAFATGRGPKHSAVAVTEGIINLLNDKELKGVIAHEFAHIKNHDILIGSFVAVLAGTIAYIASMARWTAIFGGFGDRDDSGGVIGFLVLAIVAPLIATLIHLAISRSREYLADRTGAGFISDSNSLADALLKLEGGKPMAFGNSGSAHMFIVNPFKANAILNLFSTHPPIKERVHKLREMSL